MTVQPDVVLLPFRGNKKLRHLLIESLLRYETRNRQRSLSPRNYCEKAVAFAIGFIRGFYNCPRTVLIVQIIAGVYGIN